MNVTNFSLEQQSLELLDSMFGLNIVIYLVIAPLTIFSNLLILIILSKNKKIFSSHHYSLVRHMVAVASLQAFYVMVNCGVIRTIETIYRIPDIGTILRCGLRFLPLETLIVIDRYNVFILAFDRLIAVVFPIYYKFLFTSKLYINGTFLIPYFVAIIDIGSKYSLYTDRFMFQEIVICHMPYTRTEEWLNYAYYEGFLVDLLILFIYCFAIIYVHYKIRANSSNSKQLKKELGFKLIVVCGVDALVYTCTYFLSNIFGIVFVSPAPPLERIKLGVYVMNFILISTLPRFIIIYLLNSDFRKEAQDCSCLKRNKIINDDIRMSGLISRSKQTH